MIFLDTNYFLRFLLQDNQKQFSEAEKVFLEAAQGKIETFTSIIVLFEIYWVLMSFYQRKKEEVIHLLEKILDLSFIKLEERKILSESLEKYKILNISLEDCYNLFLAKDNFAQDFKTFDLKLLKEFRKGKEKW